MFGERYERVLLTDLAAWANPDPDAWLPVQAVVEEGPVPTSLCTETVFKTKKHRGYREWLAANGRPLPATAP